MGRKADRSGFVSKEEKAYWEKIDSEIPSMVLQLILLLDAGLVLSSAFEELIDQNRDSSNPLYEIFEKLQKDGDSLNIPFVNQLYIFAQKGKSRALLRFSTMVVDHSNRGAELADKLDRQREQLWNEKLANAKIKVGEADTKLNGPLMLLLLVVIVISVAPCLMQL